MYWDLVLGPSSALGCQPRIQYCAGIPSWDPVVHWDPALGSSDALRPHSGIQYCSGIGAGIQPCSRIQCWDPVPAVLGTSIELESCARAQPYMRIQCWDLVPGPSLAPGSWTGILCQDSVRGSNVSLGSSARTQPCTQIQPYAGILCWNPALHRDPVPGPSLTPGSTAGSQP